MNYWQRWIGDWKRKTSHLSCEEKGIYGELLDHGYATERPLPDSIDALCRIVGATSASERRAIERVIAQFYERTSEGLVNRRAAEELQARMRYVNAQRERSRLGVAARLGAQPAASAHKGNGEDKSRGTAFALAALPEEWRTFCAMERPKLDPQSTFFQFRDYWMANANQRTGKKANWFAAWRTWIRREKP